MTDKSETPRTHDAEEDAALVAIYDSKSKWMLAEELYITRRELSAAQAEIVELRNAIDIRNQRDWGLVAELEAERKARAKAELLRDQVLDCDRRNEMNAESRAEAAEARERSWKHDAEVLRARLAQVEREKQRLQEGLNTALNIASCAHRGEFEWNQIGSLRALSGATEPTLVASLRNIRERALAKGIKLSTLDEINAETESRGATESAAQKENTND